MKENTILSFSDFIWWHIERTIYYVKARQLPPLFPWRFRSLFEPSRHLLLNVILKTLPCNPVRITVLLVKLLSGKITRDNFFLLAYGPKVFCDSASACESCGIKAFLILGTLRSFVLYKDLYKLSTDIDFGVTQEDWGKMDLLKNEMIQRGYVPIVDNNWELLFMHKEFHSLMVDFTRIYQKDDHMQLTWGLTEDKSKFIHHCFPVDMFQEFNVVKFFHHTTYVSIKTNEYLKIQYGETWRDIKTKKKTHYSQYNNVLLEEVVGPTPVF